MKNEVSSFEKTMDQLEQILDAMEEDDVSLEQSIAYYAKAAKLIEQSHEMLASAKVQIEEIDMKIQKLSVSAENE